MTQITALTDREREIVALVGQGMSNRTEEFHQPASSEDVLRTQYR